MPRFYGPVRAMQGDSLSIRPAGVEPRQLSAYATLLSDVFGAESKFTPDAIAWRYRDNPAGQVVGADAWDGDRLAAHYVACPTVALIDGQPVKGLLSLNTATHPDYQGRGLFTKLANAAYEQGAGGGYKFVIGVANANSTPGFLKKLAFQDVGRLHAGVLTRAPNRFAPRPLQYQGAWSGELLRWRLANPAAAYKVGRIGDVIGVWAKTHMPFIQCAAFLPSEADPQLKGRAPMAFSLYLGLDPRWPLGAQGFVPVPEKLRPSPLNLIWRPLGGGPAQLRADATAFSFLDFDPY